MLLVNCTLQKHTQKHTMHMAHVDLNIPDVKWDSKRPDKNVGWCAEACIQMALGYYGVSISQKEINDAGKPEHADLYMNEIDIALDKLSVTYIPWKPSNDTIQEFIKWIKQMLDLRYPVLCGIKIYPDEHPNWFLDHFVLIVGYNENEFIVNTNIYGQKRISYQKITSKENGFSFKSKHKKFFGRAITGVGKK